MLWVSAPRKTSRRPSNDAPEMNSFNGVSSETRRPDPRQNIHIECFAQHSVQMVQCGGKSLGEDFIPVARRGQSIRVVVESPGGDLRRRTAQAAAASVSMTLFPQHLLASLVPYMAFCRNQQQPLSTPRSCQKQVRRRKSPSRRTWQRVCRADLTSPYVKKPMTGSAWSTGLEEWTG